MRRFAFVMVVLGACAQAGVVPGEGRAPEPTEYPGRSLQWSYDKGTAAAEGVERPLATSIPNPSNERLAGTKTAMIDMPAAIEGAVEFCVGVDGKVRDARTATPTGDTKLDAVLTETVQGWRFKPALLAGQPVEACSTATFVMSFR